MNTRSEVVKRDGSVIPSVPEGIVVEDTNNIAKF